MSSDPAPAAGAEHPVDEQAAARALDALLPEPVARVERIDRGFNAVFGARLADGRDVVLKADARSVGERFLVEPLLAERVAERTAIPVPAVLAHAGADGPLDVPCFVMERLPGEHRPPGAFDAATYRRLCRTVGRYLGQLHGATSFESFGPLVVEGDELAVADRFDGWPELLEAVADRNLSLLAETRFEPWVDPLQTAADDRLDAVAAGGPYDPVAVHNDLRPGNLLVDPAAVDDNRAEESLVTGVVDWGAGLTAHAEFELATTETLLLDRHDRPGERERCRAALDDGYRETAALDDGDAFAERRRAYRFVATLRLLRHVDELTDGPDAAERQVALLREMLASSVDLPALEG